MRTMCTASSAGQIRGETRSLDTRARSFLFRGRGVRASLAQRLPPLTAQSGRTFLTRL